MNWAVQTLVAIPRANKTAPRHPATCQPIRPMTMIRPATNNTCVIRATWMSVPKRFMTRPDSMKTRGG